MKRISVGAIPCGCPPRTRPTGQAQDLPLRSRRVPPALLAVAALAFTAAWAACGGPSGPAAQQNIPSNAATAAPMNSWDALVKAAQEEGTVNVYGAEIAPITRPIREAFNQKYGVNLEFTMGRPAEVVAKLSAERNAGLNLADVGHMGETTDIMDIKPLGMTAPVAGLLVAPEVTGAQNWVGGRLPFLDKDQHVFMFMAKAIPHAVINTDVIKEGELTSFLDLLKPQYKGKIVLSDPTISGGAPNQLASLIKIFGRDRALEIIRQLAAQEPAITRDQRLQLEWVARAKYPIGLGQSQGIYSDFRKAGAPMKLLFFKEPRFISGGPSNIIVFSKNPHPKATQLYINWLLSAEGSYIWSRALENLSTRADVSKEGLDPEFAMRPDDIFPDEEQMQLRVEMRKIAGEIFGPLMR